MVVWAPEAGGAAGVQKLPGPGDLVLVGRRKGSHGAGLWALPGGWLEWGEPLDAAGARELAEETGICVQTAASSAEEVLAKASHACTDARRPALFCIDGARMRSLAVPACGNLFGTDGGPTSGALGGRRRSDVKLHTVTVFSGVGLPSAVRPVTMEPDKTDGWHWVPLRRLAAVAAAAPVGAESGTLVEAGAAAASAPGASAVAAGDDGSAFGPGAEIFPAAAALFAFCLSEAAAATQG